MKLIEPEDLRYEKKFVISEIEPYETELILKTHPAAFSEIFYQRRVNNIYFDSIGLSNYHWHLDGVTDRLKMRIRWYGRLFGLIEKPILELKIKKNELGNKLAFPLKSFSLDRNFSLKFLQKEIFLKSRLPKWLIEELKRCKPFLLNSFKRKYFISANKLYRTTIDTDLIFFKIKPENNLFYEKIIDKERNILELKYSKKDYVGARDITKYFPFRFSANSKYVTGIELLELY